MILDPTKMIESGAVIPAPGTKKQQCGIDVTLKETVDVEPGSFANVEFAEKIHIPTDAAGLIIVRSSLSRIGVFISSGLYDPGFSGVSGCSIYNLGREPIHLDANDRVAQIIFIKCEASAQYNGKYQNSQNMDAKGWK